MKFNVYEGDGNEGCSFTYSIDAADLDGAVAQHVHMMDHWLRDHVEEDGDDLVAFVTVYAGPGGETALNGAAFYCARIEPDKE